MAFSKHMPWVCQAQPRLIAQLAVQIVVLLTTRLIVVDAREHICYARKGSFGLLVFGFLTSLTPRFDRGRTGWLKTTQNYKTN